ncbi:hypothetical protein SDRG_14922 [Saprolegnia diclina VS20]|uniref:Uncharacterized protein n=1 Tax=Saprolegnia diclina (strain VS20) TaxID=1156394 RepID=T0PYI5_SAPDV|nr:hypothetical protein SDRG_14922 [Saprolegnia diclina VS20]EQC27301.1 hypothetical protein SDRG_14922 [Saprolegnia diclina VS20]|eukprot:XP_008619304.1 hypothetical protein SDRG_14922 [Saprolegnia diclina VS20]
MQELSDESLRQIEAEFDAHRRHVEATRDAYQRQKAAALTQKAVDLRGTLSDLDAQVAASRVARQTLRSQLLTKKAHVQSQMAQQLELQREAWHVTRSHELEEAARRRLDLEQLQTQRHHLERLEQTSMVQLNAIDAERSRRRQHDVSKIEHLLVKGSVLERQLPHDALFNIVAETSPAIDSVHFANECEGRLRIEHEQATHRRHDQLRQLNADRAALEKQEEDLRQKQRELHYLASKGVDFLVEIEFGHAPPVELILKNMPDEIAMPDADVDTIDEVLDDATKWLASGDTTLAAIAQSIPSSAPPVPSPLRPLSPLPRTPTTMLLQSLVCDLIDQILEMLPAPLVRANVLAQQCVWKDTRRNLRRVARRERYQRAVHLVRDALLDDVVHSTILDLWSEASAAQHGVRSLLLTALQRVLCPPDQNDAVSSAFDELQTRRRRQDLEVSTSVILVASVLQPRPPPPPTAVLSMKPATLQVYTELPTPIDIAKRRIVPPDQTMVTVQRAYWKHVRLAPVVISATLRHSIAHIYARGRHVYVVGAKGDVSIVDITTNVVVREVPGSNPIAHLEIGLVPGYLLTVQKKHTDLLSLNTAGARTVATITKDDVARPSYTVDDVVLGHILPSVSVVGAPTSAVVGTKDGAIIRLQLRRLLRPASTDARDFFHGHNSPITYLGHRGTDLVSADVAGVVCFWTMTPQYRTGFGWWVPSATVNLSATIHAAAITSTATHLALLVGGALQPQILQLSLPDLLLEPIEILLPRLRPPTEFALLPPVEGLPMDYALVSYEGILFVYSLWTGTPVSSTPLKESMVSLSAAHDRILGLIKGKITCFRIDDATSGADFAASVHHTGARPVPTMIRRMEVQIDRRAMHAFLEKMLWDLAFTAPPATEEKEHQPNEQ